MKVAHMVKFVYALDAEGWNRCSITEYENAQGIVEYSVNFFTLGHLHRHTEKGFETLKDAYDSLLQVLKNEHGIYPYVD